jgi:glycogen(starch) synthase
MTPPSPEPRTAGDVLHVMHVYGAISEAFVVDTMAELEARGWRAWVAARDVRSGHPFSFPPPERIGVGAQAPPARRLRDRLMLRGYGHREETDWSAFVRQVRPRLAHAHFGWAALEALPLARRFHLPLVVTFHGSDVTVFPRVGRRERLMLRAAGAENKYAHAFGEFNAVIAVSEFIAGRLRRLGLRRSIEIIPAGVRLGDFPFRGPTLPDGPPRLLFVGRLVRQKGPDLALRALAEVRATHPEATLEVIGEGPEADGLRALTRELGLGAAVAFRDALPRAEVVAAMGRAHVQVMASRTMADGAAEGSPVVAKEAQAIGVPLVATDNGGTRETVPPDDRHLLVAENDAVGLAAGILRALADRDATAERVVRARRFVAETFDWSELGRRTAAVYERACAEWARAHA